MKHPAELSRAAHNPRWAIAFWIYFAVLTTALLWPQLKLPPVMPRPDLLGHCVAFGLFTLLLCLWNPAKSPKHSRNALVALSAAAAYGAATELLQMIPVLNRSAGLDDWAANMLGGVCGLTVFAVLPRWVRSPSAPAARRADS